MTQGQAARAWSLRVPLGGGGAGSGGATGVRLVAGTEPALPGGRSCAARRRVEGMFAGRGTFR